MATVLNENIRQLRILNGFSQVELAKRLSVSKQCVSNWENDNVLPSISMLIQLADFFGVTTDRLLGRTAESVADLTGLTEEQTAHIRALISDLRTANRSK